MQKFLSIPLTATGETSQLVALDGLQLVDQASTTTVTLTYAGGAVVTLTLGAAMAADDVSVRDKIQDSVVAALQTGWTKPQYDVLLFGLVDAAGAPVVITDLSIA